MRSSFPIRCLVVAALLTVLAGCARSLTESQCLAGDWESVGFRDGSRGTSQSQLLEHQNACGRYGVVPDRERYLDGWHQGVARFCTPANGFARGERGASYPQVCPAALEPGFQRAWHDGHVLYQARSELARLENLHAAHIAEIDEIDAALASLALRIATDTGASAAERMAWVSESIRLARARGQLESEVEHLAADVAAQRLHVDALQQELAYAR